MDLLHAAIRILFTSSDNQRPPFAMIHYLTGNFLFQCLYSGVNIDRWAVLTFLPQRMEGAVANFASNLARQCNDMGMVRRRSPLCSVVVPVHSILNSCPSPQLPATSFQIRGPMCHIIWMFELCGLWFHG